LTAWPWRRRRSGSTALALAIVPIALFLAVPTAPVIAQAAPAAAQSPASTCLLGLIGCSATPTASPSGAPTAQATPSGCLLGLVGCGTTGPTSGPCVLGILLCGGNVISQPTPCAGGALLCGPPQPSPCVAGSLLCPGTIVGPGNPPGGGGGSNGGKSKLPASGVTTDGLGSTNVALANGIPPGVGLIPPITGQSSAGSTPNPNGFSELLSLSIRDGLSPGGSQLWPALAMLQAVLLLVIVGAFAARRVLEASKLPKS